MDTALLPLDLRSIKSFASRNWRSRVIQTSCCPPHPLRAAGVTISHEFIGMEGSRDYLNYFKPATRHRPYVGDVSPPPEKASPRA